VCASFGFLLYFFDFFGAELRDLLFAPLPDGSAASVAGCASALLSQENDVLSSLLHR
jgi:hypothetical protein